MKVILSCGMGVHSVAILVRWLLDPANRDFDLAELIVVIAQTGDEFPDTKAYVEGYLFPLLRCFQVRTIQVARASASQTDGLLILEDSTQPTICYSEGGYKLSDELLSAGTVPQYASGRRRCSVKAKGWPLDSIITQVTGGMPFRHVMGFHAGEAKRMIRDQSYTTGTRRSEYPLVAWQWGHEECETYLAIQWGIIWPKSCCTYCPFSGGKAPMIVRYRAHPEAAGFALFLEHIALALNPRMTLYAGGKSLLSALRRDGNQAALSDYESRLADVPWATYQVRRVFYSRGNADRSVRRWEIGSRQDVTRALGARATAMQGQVWYDAENGIARIWVRERGSVYPTLEEMWVVAPALVADKARTRFDRKWEELTSLERNPTVVTPHCMLDAATA